MNNEEKGIKIQLSRPFETILGISLHDLCHWTPLEGGCSVSLDSSAACLRSLSNCFTFYQIVLKGNQ